MKSENKQLFNVNINNNNNNNTVCKVLERSSKTLESGLPGFTKKNESQKQKNIILKINKIHSTFIEEFLFDSF